MYAKALDAFWDQCQRASATGFTRETVQRYRAHLESRASAPATVNLHLTVICKLAQEAAASGVLGYEAAAAIVGVKGARQKGRRLGVWLKLEEARRLLQAPAGQTLRALRDRALLALLVGCGIRGSELAALRYTQVQQREGRWVLVDIDGKGHRLHSVPMPVWAKAALGDPRSGYEVPGERLAVERIANHRGASCEKSPPRIAMVGVVSSKWFWLLSRMPL